ncbi:MAG TPA: ABC-F family ATP-binding cassette domain-containing protein [Polyangia bacterium]|nr:ABC-F family ATP-binding cassette domain-containing protein [Polyangia bacterium]
MSLAQFADVSFGYPGNDLLTGASLLIRPGDRLALVGPNGKGKSTALRLLAGELEPDAGDVRVLGRQTVAYLKQSQELLERGTLLDALLEPFADLQRMHDELAALEAKMSSVDQPHDDLDVARYGELQERYQREGGYDLESRVRRLTVDVGFTESDLGRMVETLSGGERGRLELAKVLVRQPDLLLLDEPTNHLDLAAIERLETFLADYPGAFVMVSHDRAFIRAVCREIVELEGGKFVRYPMGWDKYVVERDARLELQRAAFERQKEHVEKTEDFIRRNLAGQKTKQAQSRRKMLDKLDRLERPDDQWEHAGKIALSFQTGGDLGSKETIRAPKLTVGYTSPTGVVTTILRDVEANIYRGDKVGIVGPNGGGKSTLLKTLIGELPPLAGKVEIGTGVRIGYFDQKLGTLDESLTLEDEIRSVRADLSPESVRNYLAKFRFFGDDPFKLVKGLSGGERSRLAMAKIMLFPRNVLVLDEPTNHLDIPARETLEDALDGYEGTLIVISHDRYFLDRVCTRLLVIEGDRVEAHLGNYGDWRRRVHEQEKATAAPAPVPPKKEKEKEKPAPASDAAKDRVANKDRERELRRLERRVETLEADVAKIEGDLAAVRGELAGDHAGDWQKLHTLADRERELDALLARRMGEWEAAGTALAKARES